MRRFPSKRAAATLSVLTLCAGWVEAGAPVAASTATADHGGKGCIVVSGLTETNTITLASAGDPTTHSGENGTTSSVIEYPDGRVFGHEQGRLVVFYGSDGVPEEMYQFTDQLTGGETFGGGVIDLTAVSTGETGSYHVVGTTGRYRGLSGTWSFVLTSRPAANTTVASVTLKLCR
jgi:hypothetical protein